MAIYLRKMLTSSLLSTPLITVTLATLIAAGGCKTSDFAGSSKEPSPTPAVDANNSPTPTGGAATTPTTAIVASPNAGQPQAATDSGAGGLLGAIGNIAKIASGAANILGNVQTQTPTPNTVSFGGQQAFHIGDNYLDGTSCGAGISAYALVGTKYFFQFQVTQDGATIRATLNNICGVDFPDTNHLSLVNAAGTRVATQLLKPGQSSATISASGLPAGLYEVLVESLTGSRSAPAAKPDDADDFLVGSVSVSASVAIVAGQAGTQ